MTFAARQHADAAAPPPTGPQSLGAMVLDGATPSSSSRVASLTFNTNGTISYVNQMADPVYSAVPGNWYSPTTTSIGTGYRVRFSLQSGNAWDAGLTSGADNVLTSARTVQWTLAPTASVSAIVLVEITAVGNGTVLASGTLTVSLQSDY